MRNRIINIFLLCALAAAGCARDDDAEVPGVETVSIMLASSGSTGVPWTKVIDDDNLEVEQTVNNITVYFTEPGSDVISHSYVNSSYTSEGDYKVMEIPLNPAELQKKDIYVVTNYDNQSLNAVTDLKDLALKTTPKATKNKLLDPANGICMYGKTLNFDFTKGETAKVFVLMTCAKYRVTLTFPETPNLSTTNSFVITNTASYTYVMDHTGNTVPAGDYFDFPKRITLEPDGTGNFKSTAYIYEAVEAPRLHVYARINNKEQVFSADLPMPDRNHIYDIDVQVYQGVTRSGVSGMGEDYRMDMTVTAYDQDGNEVEALF